MHRLAVGVVLAALLLAVGVGLWWSESPGDSIAADLPPANEPGQEEPEATDDPGPTGEVESPQEASLDEETEPEPLTEGTGDERSEVVTQSVLAGRVVDGDGRPIAGAVVSWTPIPPDLSVRERYAQNLRRAARDRSIFVTTSVDGEFSFVEVIEGVDENGSVLWATHEAFAPAMRLLAQGVEGRLPEGDIVLEEALTRRALVVDADGEPAPDALVVQHGRVMPFRGETWAMDWEERLSWLLLRESTTDGAGAVPLQVFPGDQAVHAERNGKTSPSFLGTVERDVRLSLADSIMVRVAVNYVKGRPDLASPRVVFRAETGHRVLTLADVLVDEVGEQPIEIPFVDADRYTARLHSRLLVPEELSFRPQRPGEEHFVEFDGARGTSLWFFAENEEGEPLVDAKGDFTWKQDGKWMKETIPAIPQYPGYIHFSACPEGVISVTVSCEGYVPRTHAPIAIPAPTEGTYVLRLTRGVPLRGRCLADGEPVTDFVVAVWQEGHEGDISVERFRDRADGSFELLGTRSGPSLVYAASAGLGMSETVSVDTSVDPPASVTLEIETGFRGHGRVVDAETGAPLAGVSVQPFATKLGLNAGPMGPPILTDASGAFEVEGLSSETATLDFVLPEYATFGLVLPGTETRDRDLGIIRLERARDLTVRVLPPRGVSPAAIDLEVDGPYFEDRPALDDSGVVVYEAVSFGAYVVRAAMEGMTDLRRTFHFGKDSTGELVVDLSSEASVTASLLPGGTPPASESLVLEVLAILPFGNLDWRQRFGPNGQAAIRGIPPGTYSVAVRENFDESSAIYAVRIVELEADEEHHLEFRLGENDRAFRVVDREGEPVVGAIVAASPPGQVASLGNDMLTDSRGEFVLPNYPHETVILSLSHASAGHSLGVERPVPEEGEVEEIVLDGTSSLTVGLRDVNGPLQGMEPMLRDMDERFTLRAGLTDADGRVTFEHLTDGVYRFVMITEGYWYTQRRIEVFEGCPPIDVLAARRCDLQVLATTNGSPRPDVQFEFAWKTQEIPFSQLIEWGFLEADRMDLTSGPDGRLTVWGVPEGEFGWTATTSSGTTEGVLSISPEDQGVRVLEVR